VNLAKQAENAVWQLLPELHAPPESPQVAQKRAEHAAKMKAKAQELLNWGVDSLITDALLPRMF
jgi:hypothetical protein